MRAEYKRDMNHNYLILHGEESIDTASYQVRMLVGNVIPSVLKCRVQGVDGAFSVCYDITSRQPLSALFEEKKLGFEDLQLIFGGFVQVMEEMSEYLLNPGQLLIRQEYMYADVEKKALFFCYLPGFEKDVRRQFQELTEYILPRLNHEDERAVMLGYGVYRRALEDSFHLEHIKEELYRERGEADFGVRSGGQVREDLFGESFGLGNIPDEEKISFERENENERLSETDWKRACRYRETFPGKEGAFRKKGCLEDACRLCGRGSSGAGNYGCKIFGVSAGAACGGSIGNGSGIDGTGDAGFCFGEKEKRKQEEERLYRKHREKVREEWDLKKADDTENEQLSGKSGFSEQVTGNTAEADQTVKKRHLPEVGFRESAERDGCGETVVLSVNAVTGPAAFVSREPGELATIYLQEELTVVGKLENAADAVIPLPTVSRVHAKIRKRDGEYYLTDMNSKNGTSVNGRLLRPDEEHCLQNEDEVDFAQARYVFLK